MGQAKAVAARGVLKAYRGARAAYRKGRRVASKAYAKHIKGERSSSGSSSSSSDEESGNSSDSDDNESSSDDDDDDETLSSGASGDAEAKRLRRFQRLQDRERSAGRGRAMDLDALWEASEKGFRER